MRLTLHRDMSTSQTILWTIHGPITANEHMKGYRGGARIIQGGGGGPGGGGGVGGSNIRFCDISHKIA